VPQIPKQRGKCSQRWLVSGEFYRRVFADPVDRCRAAKSGFNGVDCCSGEAAGDDEAITVAW